LNEFDALADVPSIRGFPMIQPVSQAIPQLYAPPVASAQTAPAPSGPVIQDTADFSAQALASAMVAAVLNGEIAAPQG